MPSLLVRIFKIYTPANHVWRVPESSTRQRRVPNSVSGSSPLPGTTCCATWHWPQPQDRGSWTTSWSQIMRTPGLVRQTKLSSCLSTRGPRTALPCWEWTLKCRPRWPHSIPTRNVFYDWTFTRHKVIETREKLVQSYSHKFLRSLDNSQSLNPAKFYIIPKIHKSPVAGRPIAASHLSLGLLVFLLTSKLNHLLVCLQCYVTLVNLSNVSGN